MRPPSTAELEQQRGPRLALISVQTALAAMAVAGCIALHMICGDGGGASERSDLPSPPSVSGASVLATLCVAAAAPAAHVSNTVFMPKYQLFQPFSGGSIFVLLQGIGWTIWGLAAILAVHAFSTSPQIVHDAGLLGLLGTMLLVGSFPCFHPNPGEKQAMRRRMTAFFRVCCVLGVGLGAVCGLFALMTFDVATFVTEASSAKTALMKQFSYCFGTFEAAVRPILRETLHLRAHDSQYTSNPCSLLGLF